MLNLFQHLTQINEILKQVQDDIDKNSLIIFVTNVLGAVKISKIREFSQKNRFIVFCKAEQ